MHSIHLITYMTLLFYLLITKSAARSLTDSYLVKYPVTSAGVEDSFLRRPRRGYYYIDERHITPINPLNINENIEKGRRRQDFFINQKNANNKPKKLFVPNLFG